MSQVKAQTKKMFELTSRTTGEKVYQPASSAKEALKRAGLLVDDCFVHEQRPKVRHTGKDTVEMLVKIPCQVCPFQYAECIKPAELDCVTHHNAPELQEWLKQVAKSHLCLYVGVAITKADYFTQQKWCPIEKAIEELSAKS